MDIVALVEKGIARAHNLGASEVEVYIVKRATQRVSATVKGLEKLESGETIVANVRLAIGKRVTTQGALISREEDLYRLIENTIKIARTVSEDPQWVSLPKRYGYTAVSDVFDKKLVDPDLNWLISLTLDALKKPSDLDRRVSTIEVGVGTNYISRAIGNSYNNVLTNEKTGFFFSIEVKAVDGDRESSYGEYYAATTLREFNMDSIVSEAVDISIKTLGAKQIETGRYQVVLAPTVFSEILHTLIVPAVRADWVQKKRSPLIGKLRTEVFSSEITIVDDGAAPNMLSTNPFDEEGVAMQRKAVFDKGVLTTYLYDTYTAHIDGVESTGNASRGGLGSAVYPDATNIIVIPGRTNVEAILRDIRRGIVVYSTIGGWLSNPVSGYLNATIVNGVYIENGNPVTAVKNMVLSGNIYELLSKNLIALSKEVKHRANTITPYVALDKVSVAGK